MEPKLRAIEKEGLRDQTIMEFGTLMSKAMADVFMFEYAMVMTVVPIFTKYDHLRRDATTEREKKDADDFLGGADGDPVHELNASMFKMARKLSNEVWAQYDGKFEELAARVSRNVSGEVSDLPKDFIDAWVAFMEQWGWDGPDQLFMSSQRYQDAPAYLLKTARNHAGTYTANTSETFENRMIHDPDKSMQQKVKLRREAMERRVAAAGCWTRRTIAFENAVFEHCLWGRNWPKLHMSRLIGQVGHAARSFERGLLAAGRLDAEGDVFHLDLAEMEKAMKATSLDLRAMIAPRKETYSKHLKAPLCPVLIDSRNRILKPNRAKAEPGTLVGSALSPGVAKGRVRVMHSAKEKLLEGEVLCAYVTDPAWTPLFIGASAVILQVGGVLQHGALCAREYGKPGVSGIDINTDLKTGMLVTVDGNTGVVKIHDESKVDN